MQKKEYTYLRFVRFNDVENWSVSHILGMNIGFTNAFPMVPIGQIIEKSSKSIEVEDNIQYKQITLKINGGGTLLRDVKYGKDIGTKRQYVVSSGQFIMSKIDARNGAFGVISDDLDGAIVTADFPVFNVNSQKVVSQYLFLLSATKAFIRFAQSCSRGTTNRQRMDIGMFLSKKIPLPSCDIQQSLVNAYNAKIQKAADLEQQAVEIEQNIEDYLLTELGIKQNLDTENIDKDEIKKDYKYLKFVSFKNIERWDCYNVESSILTKLKASSYPIFELGNVYKFIQRKWDKKELSFDYVEIGAIDPLKGILYAEKIQTVKAPSRATQKIKTGDLIIGTTRPYLKKFAIVTDKFDDCVCSSGFQVVAPKDTYNLSYLYEFLKSPIAISQFELFMSGALYPAITNKDLKKILIPLPPLKIQNAIVENINEKKSQIKELKQLAETLRKEALEEFEKEVFE